MMHHDLGPNSYLIEDPTDLPVPMDAELVYLDVETASFDPARGGNLPYGGDRVCGVGITWDNHPNIYYVAILSTAEMNLFSPVFKTIEEDIVAGWLQLLLCRETTTFVAQNAKFDLHFLAQMGVEVAGPVVDTLTMAKVVSGQGRMRYGLKGLAEDWLGYDNSDVDEVKDELKRNKSKDYASVSLDVLGFYCCQDIAKTRALYHEIQRRRYDGVSDIWNLEVETTRALFEVEKRGLLVDVNRLREVGDDYSVKLIEAENDAYDLGFGDVKMGSPKGLSEFVFGTHDLPPVEFSKHTGAPTVGVTAVEAYLTMDEVSPELKEFFRVLLRYREAKQWVGLYADGWLPFIDEHNVMRPSYNQTVSTGRMSCREPNIQQINSLARECIIPRPGHVFLAVDMDQIEFRIIASVCRDRRVIDELVENPKADFHQVVADLVGIPRKQAKVLSFGLAYGMGVKGVIRQLRRSLDVPITEAEATAVYENYNRRFPAIKETATYMKNLASTRARRLAGEFGYILTLTKRRRALQYFPFEHKRNDQCRKAFNSCIQGTAADIMKSGLCAVEGDSYLHESGVKALAIVHDEVLFEVPEPRYKDPAIESRIVALLCNVADVSNLSVPLTASVGWGTKNWSEAK